MDASVVKTLIGKLITKAYTKLLPTAHCDYLEWVRSNFSSRFALISYAVFCLKKKKRMPIPDGHVYIRAGTTDRAVFQEIFIEQALDSIKSTPRFIIDAGGHIGLATA